MEFQYMLAPLENVTDNAFRELCAKHGCDLTFTMMARLSGIVRDNKSTTKKIQLLNDVPTQIQISGQKESELAKFLENYKPTAGFSGINFNLGCPSPELIKLGLGCALAKRISKVARMVEMVKKYGYSCSIKMRLGGNQYEKQNKIYLNLINGVDADFFIVHARHGGQYYDSAPDYSVFPECLKTGKRIIANGDIDSVEKVELLKAMGVSGVMIGRAAIANPGIFEYLKGNGNTDIKTLRQEYVELAKKYSPENSAYTNRILNNIGSKKFDIGTDVLG